MLVYVERSFIGQEEVCEVGKSVLFQGMTKLVCEEDGIRFCKLF